MCSSSFPYTVETFTHSERMPNPKDTPDPYGHPVYENWARQSPEERVKGLMKAHGTAADEPVCGDFLLFSFAFSYQFSC